MNTQTTTTTKRTKRPYNKSGNYSKKAKVTTDTAVNVKNVLDAAAKLDSLSAVERKIVFKLFN